MSNTPKSPPNAQVRARLDLRRSGAAGTHADRRTRRNRDRAAVRRRAIAESRSAA